MLISCRREVDYDYFTEIQYVNQTDHKIELQVESRYIPVSTEIAPGATYSKVWDMSPIWIDKAVVTFDGTYNAIYTPADDYAHNICDEDNYEIIAKNERHHVFKYVFTEKDYDEVKKNGGISDLLQ